MFLAVDVHYFPKQATVAGISFDSWQSKESLTQYITKVKNIASYESGKFYKRELPCILRLLHEHNLHPNIIVIDGFVFLDGHSKPGLGKYLYDSLNRQTSVIGVAKTPYKNIQEQYTLFRGKSQKPLYITAVGVDLSLAKKNIAHMHGQYRIPTLLKKVDQLSRGITSNQTN